VTELYTFTCGRCGSEATDFETCAAPGVTVWVQCPDCGQIHRAAVPGEYTGRKVRKGTQRKQDAIFRTFAEMRPTLTVRQIFYRLAVLGVVEKSARGYRQTQYQLKVLRRSGILPYGWIADNTRWQIRPTVYNGLESAMRTWHEAYRRDLWESQQAHVEIWVEKDAIAGVISPITRQYAVPLYVARGFSSMTFAHDAAEEIKEIDKPVYIYHFGDFDPSGVSAADSLRDELVLHGSDAHFESAAVTLAQVENLDLPTLRVNKKDPRARSWPYSFVCELEALPADVLRNLVRECIEQHIIWYHWDSARAAEKLERQTLGKMRQYFVQERNSGLRAEA
jgi:hypothetical protein